ncbi:MAG: PorT family protein [Bacteroidales bacterium]|nr:PorT family protein [Bacteroidales bacterium]
MNITINKVLILFLLVNTSLAGFSQKFKGGIHVGLLATQVDGDEHSGYKKAGLFAGGFVNYPFEKVPLVLQLELNYAQKGSKNNTIQYKISTHQIEMPLLLMWNCWKGLHIDLGLSFDMLVSANEYLHKDRIEDMNRFYFCDLGGIAGLHYAIKEKFIVGGRFNYSLSPIGVNAIVRNAKKVQTYMWSNALLFYVAYQF